MEKGGRNHLLPPCFSPSLPPSSFLIESLPIFHWPKTRGRETGIAICDEKKNTSTLTCCSLANQRERGPTQNPQKSTGISTLPPPMARLPPSSLLLGVMFNLASPLSFPSLQHKATPARGKEGLGVALGSRTLSAAPGPKGWENCLG